MNLKAKDDCGCDEDACTAYGILGSNGVCVKRGCICRRCLNGQNKKRGTRVQRRAAKALRVNLSGLGAGQEENWRSCFRVEVKADRQAQSVGTFYRRTKIQSDQSKAIGDHRPFVPVAEADGRLYAVIPLDEMNEALAAWAEQ